MAFMELEFAPKGATYAADCDRCGATLYTHEWAEPDHNDRRDAMQAGTLRCDHCMGHADPSTFTKLRNHYAGRYSAPGYLDCTEWHYGTNKRELQRELHAYYGEE